MVPALEIFQISFDIVRACLPTNTPMFHPRLASWTLGEDQPAEGQKGGAMLQRLLGRMCVVVIAASLLTGAGQKESPKEEGVKGTVVKLDMSRNTLTIKTEHGKENFLLTAETKYLGPRGDVSEDGIRDERLNAGKEVRIVAELSGKTAKEVHFVPRKRADKDKGASDKDGAKKGK
jgi:hypothetical protein